MIRLLGSRPVIIVARGLARAARVKRTAASWRLVTPVTFDNSVAVLDLDERNARVTIRRSAPEGDDGWPLELLHELDLTPPARGAGAPV